MLAWLDEPMGALLEDVKVASEWMAEGLLKSGYKADFQPQSLYEIERFFSDHCADGRPRPRGLLAEDFGRRLFGLGAYVGEVICRAKNGRWAAGVDNPESEVEIEVHLPDGSRIWPVMKAMKRVRNGAEDSIVAYGVGLGLLAAK